jgi:hypothetical protein
MLLFATLATARTLGVGDCLVIPAGSSVDHTAMRLSLGINQSGLRLAADPRGIHPPDDTPQSRRQGADRYWRCRRGWIDYGRMYQ